MGERFSAKKNKAMITESKDNKTTDKGLMSPEKANEALKKPSKKISVGKNDIVEREESVTTDDGRQLLK
jgi:co-chaperonin GroES (HSP10)